MENIEHKCIIKYLYIKGLSDVEIFEDMKNVFADNGPTLETVKNWLTKFNCGDHITTTQKDFAYTTVYSKQIFQR